MRKRLLIFGGLVLAVLALLVLTGCRNQTLSNSDVQAKAQRENIERAFAASPLPVVENHLTRKSVIKWMERQDQPNVPYYNYIMADSGAIVAYFVSESRPVPGCAFLSQPERVIHEDWTGAGGTVVTAPAFDGVYYSGDCQYMKFFFDASTDTLVELYGLNILSLDAPLKIDVPRLEIDVVSGDLP